MDSNKTIFSQSGWLKVIMAILLTIIFALIISLLTSGNIKNTTETTGTAIALTFVGILATFVVVSNYSQLKEIERKTEYDIKEQNKAISEMRDDFDDYVNYTAVAYNFMNRDELLQASSDFFKPFDNKKRLFYAIDSLYLGEKPKKTDKRLIDEAIAKANLSLDNEAFVRQNKNNYNVKKLIRLPETISLNAQEKAYIHNVFCSLAASKNISERQQREIRNIFNRIKRLFFFEQDKNNLYPTNTEKKQ